MLLQNETDGASNFSMCHLSCSDHTLALFAHMDRWENKSSEQGLPLSWVFKELQQHFFLLRDLHHFLVKVFVSNSDLDWKCCKPLCCHFRSRATLQRGETLILINWGLTERGSLEWIYPFRAKLDLLPCSVEIKLPIHAAFCQSKNIAMQ